MKYQVSVNKLTRQLKLFGPHYEKCYMFKEQQLKECRFHQVKVIRPAFVTI